MISLKRIQQLFAPTGAVIALQPNPNVSICRQFTLYGIEYYVYIQEENENSYKVWYALAIIINHHRMEEALSAFKPFETVHCNVEKHIPVELMSTDDMLSLF
jgi:hypothetical protein